MLQEVPEPGRPLCGFCSWLSLSAFAHCCGWLSRLPGTSCGMTTRRPPAPRNRMLSSARRNHAGPARNGEVRAGERGSMEEIGFKQDRLHPLSAPHIAWNTVLAVILATALVAVCAHISMPLGITPIPVTMQTFAVL